MLSLHANVVLSRIARFGPGDHVMVFSTYCGNSFQRGSCVTKHCVVSRKGYMAAFTGSIGMLRSGVTGRVLNLLNVKTQIKR